MTDERFERARKAVTALLGGLSDKGAFDLFVYEDWNGIPLDEEFRLVMDALSISWDDVVKVSRIREEDFQRGNRRD